MTKYSTRILDTAELFRNNAIPWNSLWERSDVLFPTVREESTELWQRNFSAASPFHVIVIEADGIFVAGMPLYRGSKVRLLRTGMLTSNDWSFCGDLLLDRSADTDAVLDHLFVALKSCPYNLLWLDPVRFDMPQWKLFQDYLQKTGRKSQWLPRYKTAVVPLKGEKNSIMDSWKKKSVRDIQRRLKNNMVSDRCEMKVYSDPAEIISLLPECFQLENTGWKAEEGGSILKQNMGDFFLEQAKLLAEQGFIRLYILFYEEKKIAFQYCYRAKRTVFVQKLGGDASLRQIAPGQILQLMINEQLIDDPEIDFFDFVGIMASYQEVWNPEQQTVGQIVLPISSCGKLFFSLYDTVMPWIRKHRVAKRKPIIP